MKDRIIQVIALAIALVLFVQLGVLRIIKGNLVEIDGITLLDEARKGGRIELFRLKGDEFYKLTRSPNGSFFDLPSGSEVYVFDLSGKLMGWCSDEGDNPSFGVRWGGFLGARELSMEEFKQRDRKQ